MTAIAEVFAGLAKRRQCALIPYLTAGFPDLGVFVETAVEVCRAGADILEIGVPFSDPVADGPIIQKTSFAALSRGTGLTATLAMAREISQRVPTPLVFMSYYNPLLQYGLTRVCRDAVDAGVRGFIVPDLIPEEAGAFRASCADAGLDLVFLAAPTSPQPRISMIADTSTGFVYLVSLKGVTGERSTLPEGLQAFVESVRAVTAKPLCVGFGICTPAMAKSVAAFADGVIVGSRLLRVLDEEGPEAAVSFVRDLAEALHGGE